MSARDLAVCACGAHAPYVALGRGVGPYAEADEPVCADHARDELSYADRVIEGELGEMRLDDSGLDGLGVVP